MIGSTTLTKWYVTSCKAASSDGRICSDALHWPGGPAPDSIAFLAVAGATGEHAGLSQAWQECQLVRQTVINFLKGRPKPSDLEGIKSAAEGELPELLTAALQTLRSAGPYFGDPATPETGKAGLSTTSAGVIVSVMLTEVFALYIQLGAGELMTVGDEGAVRHPMRCAQPGGISPSAQLCRTRCELFPGLRPALILASATELSTPLSKSKARELIMRARRQGSGGVGQVVREVVPEIGGSAFGVAIRSLPEEQVTEPPPRQPKSDAPSPALAFRPLEKMLPSDSRASVGRFLRFDELLPSPVVVEHPTDDTVVLPSLSTSRKPLTAYRLPLGLSALLVVVVLVGLYLPTSGLLPDFRHQDTDVNTGSLNPTHRLALKALVAGNISSPPGRSAISYFDVLYEEDPDSEEVRNLGPRIVEAALPIGEDSFSRFYTESDQEIDWVTIRQIYESLVRIDPANSDFKAKAAYCRAHLSFDKRDYDEALVGYQEALKQKPDWALALNGIAKTFVRTSKTPEFRKLARMYYERAYKADSNFIFPIINLARMDMNCGEWRSAEKYLAQVIRELPERPAVYRDMARVQEKLGRTTEAIKYYELSMSREESEEINRRVMRKITQLRDKD